MNHAKRCLKAGSQCDRLLAHLARRRTINPNQALSLYGVRALSQRMGELKRRGHQIQSELITVRGRFGKARVAEYWLEGR
jgi:hypothetical protein